MFISGRSIGLLAIGLAVFAFFQLFTELYYVSAIGVAMFVCVFVKFVQDLGKRIEVRDLIAFLAILQWVLGPVLAYNVLPYDELYWMDVPEPAYMGYVVPACLALIVGLYFPLSDDRLVAADDIEKVKNYANENPYIGYFIAGVGIAAGMVTKYLPASLSFLFFLLSGMQFVGVYLILFSNSKIKWLAFAGVMGMVIFAAVLQGMFGELVLWMMFALLVIAFVLKIPMIGKIAILSLGMLLVMLLQSTKQEYRMATWYAESDKSNSQIFQEIVLDRISQPAKLFEAEPLENVGARLNQGWIIARIMGHMPEKYAFVKGETIETAIYAGLLPRVLAPTKAKAGGRANFERFTGTELPESTSMDISLVGEGFANYGVFGGIVFLLIIGLFYNLIIIKVIAISKNHPSLVLWLPILFFQVIKAETDFATVFNHFTKAALVTYMVFWGMNKVLKMHM
jgi:hypothetical protein